jgi:hypothetical protein
MKQLVLLLLAYIFLFLALFPPPLQSYSRQAVGIITDAECRQTPGGRHACDLRVSYHPNSYTMLNDIPVKTHSSVEYTFGGTPPIYFNPANPKQISMSRHAALPQWNLLLIIAALATILISSYTSDSIVRNKNT